MESHTSTQVQAAVIGALETLNFKFIEPDRTGGPSLMQITPDTIDKLRDLQAESKCVSVESDGSISIADDPTPSRGNQPR